MDEVLTIVEIESRFPSEWVLVAEPETDQLLELQKGKIAHHSKDRDEVYRRAMQLRPLRFAIVYTGTLPKDAAIVL